MTIALDEASFMSLRIAAADDVAEGIRRFELVDPAGGDLPAFTPGSHISVLTPNGAKRKYSLCNDAAERHRYVISVKREVGGRGGSISLIDGARVGDTVRVSAPDNAFPLVENAARYIFIAGGIGITPILSMIRSLGPDAPWKLYYLSRSPDVAAYLEELGSPAYRGKVVIHHDYGDPNRAFDLWPVLEKPGNAHIYCCGPRPLMESVRDMTGHWSPANIHFESFNEGGEVRPDDRPFTVRLERSGKTVTVPVGQTILAALRSVGCVVPSSCESGTCGTCKTRLLAGTPDHRDMVLLPEEFDTHIMVCVSRAQSDELALDV
jgi:phthalate 4,5-dioxygenase reductase subunit